MAHLLCTDQPKGAIASWAHASSQRAGQDCRVVGYALALRLAEQRAFDAVVVDLDRLSDASLSLLTALWKCQPPAPVWLATRAGGRAERLLGRCAPEGPARLVESAAGARVALRAMSSLSATKLIALNQLSGEAAGDCFGASPATAGDGARRKATVAARGAGFPCGAGKAAR